MIKTVAVDNSNLFSLKCNCKDLGPPSNE